MAVNIDISDSVGALSGVCTQLRVTLPGGVQVQGTVPKIGASPLEAARATIGALNSAMAPLAPVFKILEAVLSIVKFATTVPKVVTRPDKVVAALVEVVQKAGGLAALVPQLSVPIMIVGFIDVIITFLEGISNEVSAIAGLEAKHSELQAIANEVAAMGPVADGLEAQIAGRKAQVTCAMGDVQPLLGIINMFCELIGLPPITLTVDGSAESLAETAAALDAAVETLQSIRAAIPI